MLSEVFYTILLTTVAGLILKLFSLTYKSKCKQIECGCIKITRDIEAEEKEHEFDVNHQTNLNNSTKNNEKIED